MRNLLLTLVFLVFSSSALMAHEGKDHDAPTTIKAPKGGVVKALDASRVEVVAKGKSIKIYLYDKDMKPAVPGEFSLVAQAELPRSKKVEEIKLEPKDSFFEGAYDAKGVHRYKLKLEITHSKTGQTDKLTFNVEPRK